jgi:hypothetical protein
MYSAPNPPLAPEPYPDPTRLAAIQVQPVLIRNSDPERQAHATWFRPTTSRKNDALSLGVRFNVTWIRPRSRKSTRNCPSRSKQNNHAPVFLRRSRVSMWRASRRSWRCGLACRDGHRQTGKRCGACVCGQGGAWPAADEPADRPAHRRQDAAPAVRPGIPRTNTERIDLFAHLCGIRRVRAAGARP